MGSIYLSVNNVNPGTLFGGTWVAWGSGRMPIGVNVNDANYNAPEKAGGAATHVHPSPQHTHGINSHSHTTGDCILADTQIPSHIHGLNKHAHSIPVLSGTAGNAGSHSHTISATSLTNPITVSGAAIKWLTKYTQMSASGNGGIHTTGAENLVLTIPSKTTEGAGAHTHGVTTNQSTTSQNNDNTSAAGGSQAHNHGSTGGTTLTTNNNAAANTGSASSLPPYITCYMWKRTA